MRREPLVEERVVRVQEIGDRTVLAQHMLEEHRRLGLHRLAQLGIPFLELVRVRLDGIEVARLEPLAGEVRGKGGRARVGEHPVDLRFEHRRFGELARLGQRQQRVVRHRAPEEIADARCELERRHLVHERRIARVGIALDAEEEIGRHEQRLDGELYALLRRLTAGHRAIDETRQRIDLTPRGRPPIRAPRQVGDDLFDARAARLPGRRSESSSGCPSRPSRETDR